jgi:predicted ATPase
VGREYESGLLQQRWEQACEGQGQVVVISGESGIGKSRLVLNLKEQLKAQKHYRIELQTSPHFQHTPLYPVVDFVRRLLRVTPEDTPADKLTKLEKTLVRFQLPFEESVPLVSDLLAFPIPVGYRPLTLSPQVQRRRTLLTLIAICQELAERHPLLFIMEDLHWGDPSTLELLDLLIEQIPTTSILAVLTCRLEFQRLWGAHSYLTHVTLARLPRVQMVQLAMSIVKENPLSQEMLD